MSAGSVDAFVLMGVAGSGKSAIGRLLSERLGWSFVDADDLHSLEAVTKMAGGTPLSDLDRGPWLDRVGEEIRVRSEKADRVVMACSALRRMYRDRLRTVSAARILFIHLDGDAALLHRRISERAEHFMPPALLASQLETLEPLQLDEKGIRLDIAAAPEALVDSILSANAPHGLCVR